MVASCPEPDETSTLRPALLETARKPRLRSELLVEAFFRPLANLVVLAALPLRVPPVAVLLANAGAGIAAAAAIVEGELVWAALLLQLKTVLDNADGQLARASGRASALGRYLDTEADLLVNVVLFAALGSRTSSPVLAVVALVALTTVLTVDFNEEVLYRRARGESVVTEPLADREGHVARALAWLYRAVYAPQDRAYQAVAQSRLDSVLASAPNVESRLRGTLAYHDDVTATILANLGLSTQLALLGLFLVLGAPAVYLWLLLGFAAAMPLLHLRRELSARQAFAG